ncbi:hypothetical protein QBC44DRAFT_46265 [Cladorrhinum sp. PSN332]|nr:hypothetical protein QBC44DRAFT_46265 [Cladorrhinum sp. PSN332]
MTHRNWEHAVPNGTMPTSEQGLSDTKVPDVRPPAYEDVAGTSSHQMPGPPKLQILAATWGGVIVTPEIQMQVTPDSSEDFDTITLNMHTMHTDLIPDPNIGIVKSLSLIYKYSDSNEIHLLNVPQFAPQINFTITPKDHVETKKNRWNWSGTPQLSSVNVSTTAWRDATGKVEILAAVYGIQRVQTPSVLEELARFFRGERGQIRTTSEFFRASAAQPFVGPKKTWTIYFRLLTDGSGGKVRCVTGWEDGALEIPWTL